MSALELREHYVNQDSPFCIEEGCHRRGKYTIHIAGWDVVDASGERERLCGRHAPGFRALWDELADEAETLQEAA